VLILDEPLNGLDPLVRAETIALFRSFAKQGCHVLLSSHVLHEVDIISDQVILMSGGYVIAEGNIQGVRSEIQDQPMQILIRCDRPSDLASRVFNEDHVVEVRVHNDRRGLLVKTSNPDRFYLLMNKIALDGVGIESVAPVDDDVNSVYEYLIGTEEVTR
jgi:ABC-2 type transport system ATP-binding protein